MYNKRKINLFSVTPASGHSKSNSIFKISERYLYKAKINNFLEKGHTNLTPQSIWGLPVSEQCNLNIYWVTASLQPEVWNLELSVKSITLHCLQSHFDYTIKERYFWFYVGEHFRLNQMVIMLEYFDIGRSLMFKYCHICACYTLIFLLDIQIVHY